MEAANRALMALVRFATAAQNMGWCGAFNVYVRSRWDRRLQSVNIHRVGKFWYRGGLDFGVMSHFYNDGYHILDHDGHRITRIIDGGANIGVETRRFAYFHPQATIVAVEPAQSNYDVLKRNARGHPSIVPIRAALWPRPGQLAIIPGDAPEGFSVTEADRPDLPTCDTITISDILRRMGWAEIDILKLDIEGAEYDVRTRVPGLGEPSQLFHFRMPRRGTPGGNGADICRLAGQQLPHCDLRGVSRGDQASTSLDASSADYPLMSRAHPALTPLSPQSRG
jgi:FkbM family methyltransferase